MCPSQLTPLPTSLIIPPARDWAAAASDQLCYTKEKMEHVLANNMFLVVSSRTDVLRFALQVPEFADYLKHRAFSDISPITCPASPGYTVPHC